MAHYSNLQHGIHALKCTFEIIAAARYQATPDELIAVQEEIVKSKGKYSTDWKNDKLEKLVMDHGFCIEMAQVLEEDEELSYARRLRLYRFVTMNEEVSATWERVDELSPNLFLDKSERQMLKMKKSRRYK